jgi:hypothetical protein
MEDMLIPHLTQPVQRSGIRQTSELAASDNRKSGDFRYKFISVNVMLGPDSSLAERDGLGNVLVLSRLRLGVRA